MNRTVASILVSGAMVLGPAPGVIHAAGSPTNVPDHAARPAPVNREAAAPDAYPEPPYLPPADLVRRVLAEFPSVRAAASGIDAARSRRRRLDIGPYDWSVRAGIARRTDEAGARHAEPEGAIERPLRWPDKAEADRRLGRELERESTFAYADTWHETARRLLADWFGAQRELRLSRILATQADLVAGQLQLARRRARAGDAAQVEVLAYQAEQARTAALAEQARSRAEIATRTLALRYPALPSPDGGIDTPMPPLPDDADAWAARIAEDNHELELAQAQAAVAERSAERARANRRADPTVGVRASRERGGLESIIGVFVQMPFGPAGRDADAQTARAEAARAGNQSMATERRVRAEAMQVAIAAFESRAVWERLEQAREDTARFARLQQRARELGEASLTEVLQARRLALEATVAAEGARMDMAQAHARLLLDAHRLWPADHHEPD